MAVYGAKKNYKVKKVSSKQKIYAGRRTKAQKRRSVSRNTTKNWNLRKKEKRRGIKSGKLGYHHGRSGVKLKRTGTWKGGAKNKIMAPKGGFRWGAGKNPDKAIRKMAAEGRSKQYMLQQLAHIEEANQLEYARKKALGARTKKDSRNFLQKGIDWLGNVPAGPGGATLGKNFKSLFGAIDKGLDKGFKKIGIDDELRATEKWLRKNASAGDVVDYAGRLLYGNANVLKEAIQKGGKRPGDFNYKKAYGAGLKGRKKTTSWDLITQLEKTNPKLARNALQLFSTVTVPGGGALLPKNVQKAGASLALDVALDPLTYFGVGAVNKGSQIAKHVGKVPYIGTKTVIDKVYKPNYLSKGSREIDKISKALAKAEVRPAHFRNTKVGKELMAGRSARSQTKKQYYRPFAEDEIRKVLTKNLNKKVKNRAARGKLVHQQNEWMDELTRPLDAIATGKSKGLSPSELSRSRQLTPIIRQGLQDEEARFARALYGDAAGRSNIGREDRIQYWYDEAADSLEEMGTPLIQNADGTWRLNVGENPPRIDLNDAAQRAANPASVMKQTMEEIDTLHNPVGKLNAVQHLDQAAPVNKEIRVRKRALEKFKNFWTPSKGNGDYDFAIKVSDDAPPVNLKDPDFETRMSGLITQADRTAAHEINVLVDSLNTHPRPKAFTIPPSVREAFKADGNMMPKKINGEWKVPSFHIRDFEKWLKHGTQTERLRKVSPERIAFNRIIEEQAGKSLHELRALKQEALGGYDSSVRVPLGEETIKANIVKADAQEAIRLAKEQDDMARVQAIEQAVKESQEAAKAVRKELRVELILNAVRRSAETDKVGLALRVMGKDTMLIPGSRQFLQAMQVVNSAPVLSQITAAINKGFKPVQRMDWQLQDLMKWKHATNASIKDDMLRIGTMFKGMEDPSLRVNAWNNLVRLGTEYFRGDTTSIESKMIDYIENWIRPILNGDTAVGGRTLTIGEVNRYMPKRYLLQKYALEGQFKNADDVLRAFGTQSRPHQITKSYGGVKKVKDMPARPIDPENLLGNIRAAIHQAHAWRHFNDGANEFGYRVDDVLNNPNANSFTAGADEKLLKLGWKSVKGLDQSHIFPPEIATDLQKVADMFSIENIDETLKFFDKMTRTWKIPATILNPGYYTRNALGEGIMGFLGGVDSPIWYKKSASVLNWSRKNDAPLDGGRSVDAFNQLVESGAAPAGRVMVKRKDGSTFTIQEAKLAYEDEGLTSTFTRNEIRDPHADPVAEFMKQMGGLPMNPGPYLFGKVRRFGEVAEDHPRMAHFLHALQHAPAGLSKQEVASWAAREVRKYHFDYSDVTPFEQAVMARIFPFYKWTRKAIPVVLEMLMAQPGKVMLYPKMMTALAYAENPDYQADGLIPDYEAMDTPEFLRNMLAYPIGVNGEGKDIFTRIAVPATDIFQTLFDPAAAAKLMLNPFAKVPIEWLQGHNLGNTGELDEDGFQKFTDYLRGAAQSLPQSKFLMNNRESDESYLDKFSDDRGFNFGTGATTVPWGNDFIENTNFLSKWQQTNMDYQLKNIPYEKKGMKFEKTDRLIKKMSNPKNNPYVNSYTEVNLRKKYNPDRYPGADKYIDNYGRINWPAYNAFARQYTATHSPKQIKRNKVKANSQQLVESFKRQYDFDPKTKNFKYKKFK